MIFDGDFSGTGLGANTGYGFNCTVLRNVTSGTEFKSATWKIPADKFGYNMQKELKRNLSLNRYYITVQ